MFDIVGQKGCAMNKKLLIITGLVVFLTVISGQSTVSLSNDKVAVVVNRATGQFTIGRVEGVPLALVEGYPSEPRHTYFCIKVGVEYYCNISIPGTMPMRLADSANIYSNTISLRWFAGTGIIWEKFYLLNEIDSLRGFVYIEYMYYNDQDDSAYVGIFSYNDVRVGPRDNPLIEIPGDTFTTEREYTGTDVPAYFTLFRNYGDYICDVAQGVPIGRDMLYADMIVFTDTAYAKDSIWSVTTSGRPINDLAVIIRWDQTAIGGYEAYLTGFYYGVGYPTAAVEDKKLLPTRLVVGNPYPNPTNGAVSLSIRVVDYTQDVIIRVHDLSGNLVKTIFSGRLTPGRHNFTWDLADQFGKPVSSGIYLLDIVSGLTKASRRIAVVR